MFSGSSGECKSTTHGSEFRGTSFIKTASGITCQRWDQDSPHNNSYNDDPSKMQKLALQGLWVLFKKQTQVYFYILLVKTGLELVQQWTMCVSFARIGYLQCIVVVPLLSHRKLLQKPRQQDWRPMVLHHRSQWEMGTLCYPQVLW